MNPSVNNSCGETSTSVRHLFDFLIKSLKTVIVEISFPAHFLIPSVCCYLLVLAIVGNSVMASDNKDTDALFEKKSDKERIYKVPIETMWKACMKAAAEDNVIDYSNEKEGIITYKSGMSMASWGFRISVNLTTLEDGRTRIELNTQKTERQLVAWGAGGRTAEKFFKGLDKQLQEKKLE